MEPICYFGFMILLTAFLVPVAYLYYISGRPESERYSNRVAALSGLVSGLFAVAVDRLFSPLVSLPVGSLWARLLLVVLSDTLIPFLAGVLPLWFISISPVRKRVFALRPQFFGVAAVYLPYKMLAFYDLPDVWPVAFIPAMILSILFLADFFIGRLLGKVSGNPDAIDLTVAVLPVVVGVLLADLCIALWFLCFPFWTYGLVSLVLIFSSIILRILKYYK